MERICEFIRLCPDQAGLYNIQCLIELFLAHILHGLRENFPGLRVDQMHKGPAPAKTVLIEAGDRLMHAHGLIHENVVRIVFSWLHHFKQRVPALVNHREHGRCEGIRIKVRCDPVVICPEPVCEGVLCKGP